MNQLKAQGAITVSAMVVTIVYGYRKLVEKNNTSPPTAHFIIGFGFVFISLSVVAMAAPEIAGGMAVLIATADLLANGQALIKDYQGVLTDTAKATGTTKG